MSLMIINTQFILVKLILTILVFKKNATFITMSHTLFAIRFYSFYYVYFVFNSVFREGFWPELLCLV